MEQAKATAEANKKLNKRNVAKRGRPK